MSQVWGDGLESRANAVEVLELVDRVVVEPSSTLVFLKRTRVLQAFFGQQQHLQQQRQQLQKEGDSAQVVMQAFFGQKQQEQEVRKEGKGATSDGQVVCFSQGQDLTAVRASIYADMLGK